MRGFSCIRHASLTLTAILGTYSEDGRWYLSASSPVDLPCECATSYLSAPQATGSDIPYPPLPHPKAVLAGLTPEGIDGGKTEHPFPEPSTDSLCPFLTTVRAKWLSHGGAPLLSERHSIIHRCQALRLVLKPGRTLAPSRLLTTYERKHAYGNLQSLLMTFTILPAFLP